MNPDFNTPQSKTRKTETVWILKKDGKTVEFRDAGGTHIRYRTPWRGAEEKIKRQVARDLWNKLVSEGWVFTNSCVQWDSKEFMDYKKWEEKELVKDCAYQMKNKYAKEAYKKSKWDEGVAKGYLKYALEA